MPFPRRSFITSSRFSAESTSQPISLGSQCCQRDEYAAVGGRPPSYPRGDLTPRPPQRRVGRSHHPPKRSVHPALLPRLPALQVSPGCRPPRRADAPGQQISPGQPPRCPPAPATLPGSCPRGAGVSGQNWPVVALSSDACPLGGGAVIPCSAITASRSCCSWRCRSSTAAAPPMATPLNSRPAIVGQRRRPFALRRSLRPLVRDWAASVSGVNTVTVDVHPRLAAPRTFGAIAIRTASILGRMAAPNPLAAYPAARIA